MPAHFRNSDLYRERLTESALVYDYPADEPLIRGLHALQAYFATRNARIDIPVVQVMNTAHFAACYMFSIPCADQMEYDMLVYDNMGSNKQLAVIAMIVLSAMLKRTDEPRASTCRSILLEDRSEDFYEGVSLYEQFLESEELHFAAEDFETDIMNEVTSLRVENEQLIEENRQLKYTITTMEKQKPQTIVYNYGTYNDIHDNPNSTIYACPEQGKTEDVTPIPEYFKHLTQKCIDEKRVDAVDAEIKAACKGTAEGLWRTLWDNENLGYVAVASVDATTLYKDIEERYGTLPFKERQFRSARNKRYEN